MPGGCLEAKPASVPFVLSENRARRGSDLPINPEPEPSAELQGEGGAGSGAGRSEGSNIWQKEGLVGCRVKAEGERVGAGCPLYNQ